MIFVQSKSLKGYAKKLKGKFTYAMKEANDENMDQEEEKNQFLNLQERIDKIFLKLATLKISFHLNIPWMREENDKYLNTAKENGTTETIKELDKLCHITEGKKVMWWKVVRNEKCLWKNLSHCNRFLMKKG